jgi:mono/diheme cytochrome c family protein
MLAGGSLAFALAITYLFHGGMSARPTPSRVEAILARQARHWAVPSDARARRNPVPASEEGIAEARSHFADHCALCHANDGSGDTKIGQSLYPRAPDMRLPATQDLSDGEIYWVIENGIRLTGMPAWGEPGSESESWELVHFIRLLPKLSRQEILEMEALNPRGPEEWRERDEEERFLRGDEAEPPSREEHHGHGSAQPHAH